MITNLDIVKQEIIRRVENIEYDHINEGVSQVKRALHVLELLKNADVLADTDQEIKFETVESLKKSDITETKKVGGQESKTSTNHATGLPADHYIFQKRIFGGHLIGLPDSYLSEKIVRDSGFESGDMIFYKGINNMRLVERQKSNVKDEPHILYPLCEIKVDEEGYYCDSTFSGYDNTTEQPLMINGEHFRYYIPDHIFDSMRLEVGCFVDLAGRFENDRRLKVVWRHVNDEYIKPKLPTHYKDANYEETSATEYDIDLQEHKILVIGFEPKKAEFRKVIEQCNGRFLFIDGEAQLGRLYTACNRADVVLILKDFMHHVPVNKTVEHCKDIGVPFKVVDGVGLKTVVMDAEELVNQIPTEISVQ